MVKKKLNLPDDIIESNILTRLPVKTLIRFTTVCKSWHSLLSDPYFTNLYNHIQKNNTSNFLLVNNRHENSIVVTNGSSREQSFKFTTADLSHNLVDVVGCCDGLVCVFECSFNMETIQHKITLWNPSLRIKKIVDINEKSASSITGLRACVGFGFHKQSNDYNVVKFYNDFLQLNHVVEVYSLNSDSWRKIELDSNQLLLTDRYTVQQYGVYVMSSYYWLARKWDNHKGYFHEARIISFHMKDEAFKEITLPYAIDHRGENTLFVCKDSLALLHSHNSDDFSRHSSRMCYIWMMKEYDDPKSWFKLCKFDSLGRRVLFVGIIETDLMLLLLLRCVDRGYKKTRIIKEEVILVDIGESQLKMKRSVKDIGFLRKANWVCSFSESLALLKGVHSKNSCSN